MSEKSLSQRQDLRAPTGCLINGQWVEEDSTFAVLNKYTGKPIAQVAHASQATVSEAVAIARRAADGQIPDPEQRSGSLLKAAELLEARRDSLAAIMTAEAGFTGADSHNEINRAIATLTLSAHAGLRLVGQMVPFAASPGAHRRLGFTQRFPIGVVCAITPFNSPLNTVLHKVAPAYAGGNAVVLKPSPFTPLTANVLGEVLLEAGVPAQFLAIVHGDGDSVGAALLANQDIDFYTFTGSTRVGRIVQAAAGLRRTQMELGSIASTIVCADADLHKAIPKIVNAGFRKAGQVCTSVQRLYVHQSLEQEVLQRLTEAAQALVCGDPADPDTQIGPLISRQAAERAQQWLEQASKSGAKIACGGTRNGSVLTPTVLTQVPQESDVWCREAFAPMLSISGFETLDQAIDSANATPFGLSAGVFTQDIDAALKMARSLRFGAIHINESSSARADVMPFGGVKESGFGREGPDYAILEMTEERLVTLNP